MDLVGRSAASTSLAIDKLVSLLTGEEKLVKGVRASEVRSLRDELVHLRTFLEDADARSGSEESLKVWLIQMKEVAELIEDVIDEYILKVSQRPRQQRGFVSFLGKAGRLIGTLNSRRNLASNIQNIKALLLDIKTRGQSYNLVEHGSSSGTTVVERYHPRFVSPALEGCVVGFDSAVNELIQRLTEGATGLSVISIVGAGGIGKTTLAKKVYADESVRERFDSYAWIPVSQSYNMKQLLQIMTWQICNAEAYNVERINMLPMEELTSTLRQFLQ
ncbi:NB-ARC domain containing protein [Trema orientale]|uniref:NB-ARC domain containing protein n=1 Tax=Trema orientale TaxID=63057 RepID=A0A2P5EMC1_TREOI|nr:NB-ARC domain containing protein [Trema orientale]